MSAIKVLEDRLTELQTDNNKFQRGLRGEEQPRWFFSDNEGEGGEKPGKFDFEKVRELFDRAEAGDRYAALISGDEAGLKQDLALGTIQSDLLSGMERDYFMRHRSRIRRLAHEAVSRAHVGSQHGFIETGLRFYLRKQFQRLQFAQNLRAGAIGG